MFEQCTICQSSPVHAWRVNTTAINFYRLNTFFTISDWNNNKKKENRSMLIKSHSVCLKKRERKEKQQISPSSVLNTFGYGLVCLRSHS